MVGITSWSLTAGSNGSADSNINFAEGQTPASLNNSARAQMAALRAWHDSISGNVTYGGSSSDYTITNPSAGAWASYVNGIIALKANHTNDDTTVNVNVDGLGNKRVKTCDGGDPAIGDIVSGGIYLLAYDGTNLQILNTIGGGSYQPLDATLTALAALSWSSGNPVLQFTAADTVSLTLAPSVTSVTVSQGATATPSFNFASATNYGLYYVTGDVGFSANGGVTASYNTARWQWFVPARFAAGSAAAPGQSFADDTDCGWYRIGANNLGFSLNGTKYGDFSTTIFDLLVPTRARMPRSAEVSGTLTAASANKLVVSSAGVTINDGVFTADDVVAIYNDSASPITITQDTGMTLRLGGSTTTGNRTLGARGMMTVMFLSNSEGICSGHVT